MSRRASAAVNQVTTPVADYAADPHQPSWGLFKDVLERLNFLPPFYGGGDLDPGNQWAGDTQPPQKFAGLGMLQVTGDVNSIFRNGSNDISEAAVEGQVGDPVRRILADRMRRQQAIV